MMYSFNAYGHKNILATHKTTLEFTKDSSLTLNGNCIVGINSDFDSEKLRQFIESIAEKNNKNITIEIRIKNNGKIITDRINAVIAQFFSDGKEIVIRKSNFASRRTFAVRADKSAGDLSREFVDFLKNPEQKIEIVFIA